MLRRTAVAAQEAGLPTSIPHLVSALQRHPAYLRHAPPSTYITCDVRAVEGSPGTLQRHRTRLLDTSFPGTPAQTAGVYLLSTTSVKDAKYENVDNSLSSVLLGVPRVASVEEAKQFVQTNEAELRQVHLVALPDVHETAGTVLRELKQVRPDLKIAGSAFSKALMTDSTFFAGLRKTAVENDPHVRHASIQFAEIPETNFILMENGASVPVHHAIPGRRLLRAYAPVSAAREKRVQKLRRRRVPHFEYQPFFFHDPVFDAMHVGGALIQLRWLPHVVTEASRDVVLPAPPLLAAAHASEGPLLETWRVAEAAEAIAAGLRSVPCVQRVLSSTYGEMHGDVEEVISSVEAAAHKLERLRSRLARRLETDTGRDVRRWADALQKKILDEALCLNKSSQPTAPEVKESFHHWASTDSIGRLSAALSQAALALPPTALSFEEKEPPPQPSTSTDLDVRSGTAQLENSVGTAFLCSLFEKRGLQGLARAATKNEIDVAVFLSMSPDDFRKVFKATFGVSKKLELLQKELRERP